MAIFNCPLCDWHTAPTLKGIVRHIGSYHAHEANFNVYCGISDCPRSYRKFHSYRKHLYVCHRELMDITPSGSMHNGDTEENEYNDDGFPSSPTTSTNDSSSHPTAFSQRDMALFIMKCKEIHKISQSSLQGLICDITTILQLTTQHLYTAVKVALINRFLRVILYFI